MNGKMVEKPNGSNFRIVKAGGKLVGGSVEISNRNTEINDGSRPPFPLGSKGSHIGRQTLLRVAGSETLPESAGGGACAHLNARL